MPREEGGATMKRMAGEEKSELARSFQSVLPFPPQRN